MTGRRFVLANSPVVGPLALQTLADALAQMGVAAVVPSAPCDVDEYVAIVADAVDASSILVGFSAAGPRLFAVAERCRPAGIVFLDARLPVDGMAPVDETALAELLDRLPVDADGMLPPWPAWWPDEVMAAICPDDTLRKRFVRECPPVPRSMYDQPIPAPPYDGPCGYVAFGDAYADQRELATERGWPTVTLDLAHLGALVAPDAVGPALVELVERMEAG